MRIRSYIILGLVIIFGCIGWGMYLTSRPSRAIPYRPPATATSTVTASSSIDVSTSTNTQPATSASATTTQNGAESPKTCAENLKQKTRADGTEYERGYILVGFKSNVTFAEAMGTLTKYNVRVLNTANAESNYPSLRLITATVDDGQEFVKICELKQHPSVRYTDLNVLVSLHD